MRVTSPLVLAVAVVTVACDQLLPDRAPAVAVAPPSADSAKPKSPAAARPRRRDSRLARRKRPTRGRPSASFAVDSAGW